MSVKNTMKKIGQRAYLGDIISQTYPIYACTCTYHFIGSQYTLLQLEASVFKVTLEKKLNRNKKSQAYGTI